jgi:hypothetical protein
VRALRQAKVRRWLVFAVAALSVVCALLLTHMFEAAHPSSEAASTTATATVSIADPSQGEVSAASLAPAEDGVPHDQALILECVLAVVAAFAVALFVSLLRQDFCLTIAGIVRTSGRAPAFLRTLAPSLESLAISRT